MIILFHFAALNRFQTIIAVQGLLELRAAVGTVAASLCVTVQTCMLFYIPWNPYFSQ
jgi:hypothetical protein